MPSRMCPLDALAIAACATGGTPPSSAIALKIAVKLPVVNAVDTSLRAIVSLVCSSGVNMFVPLPNDANDLFSTGVIAWVAIGISALAPQYLSICHLCHGIHTNRRHTTQIGNGVEDPTEIAMVHGL